MTIGLIGRKAGMTRVFTDAGESIPVTVIEALPNRVTQVKAVESDGYRAVQVAFGDRKPSRLTRSLAGHYAKAKVAPGETLVEFRLADGEGADLAAGAELKVDMFAAGQVVDVAGTTVGKGFAGTIKRHNFAGGPASHGASLFHRTPGLDRPAPDAGPRVPGQAHVRSHGQRAPHHREPAGSSRSTPPATCCWCAAPCPGAPGGQVIVRPSVKAARRAARKTIAPKK